MARLGGCRYLAMMMTVALVCFAFSTTTSSTAAEVTKEEINKTAAVTNEEINKTAEVTQEEIAKRPKTAEAYGPIKLGAWGYVKFPTFDHSGYDGIKSIKIRHGWIIDSIQVTYVKKGRAIETLPVGGSGGAFSEIKLQYPNEYLSHIQGSVGSTFFARAAIKDLKLHTNLRTYGPFGSGGGNWHWQAFDSYVSGKKIVGFYGDTTIPKSFLASIGVYIDYI